MFLFLKKKQEDHEEKQAPPEHAGSDLSWSEFIPYSSHYNPHTLLTKNGELLQIVKIARNAQGLSYESGAYDATVREVIRKNIMNSVKTDRFSLWIHTLRKRLPIDYESQFPDALSTYVDQKWQDKHPWKYQFYNEIYITVLHEGQTSRLLDKKNLRQVMLPQKNRRHRNQYLENACLALDETVHSLLTGIRSHYQAERLTLEERPCLGDESKMVFYSQPVEFLANLLNLREEEFPVTPDNISKAMITTTPTFGFNAVETRDAEGRKRFGALLSLKHYMEVPPETVDRLLQAPLELIISQSYNFVSHKLALKEYKVQKRVLTTSGDQYALQASGIDEMLRSHKNLPTDFGEHQTGIMVLSDEYKDLDGEVQKVHAAFADLGLISIREDIKLEEGFWSRLPGNFEFMRRKRMINTEKIAGLCRLNRYPNGDSAGNHWGDAVCLIPTRVNSPYFFNFHKGDNGHTLFFDYNAFQDSAGNVLLNFLLAGTRKFGGRLVVFDLQHASELFFNKLGGNYHHFIGASPAVTPLGLCPFSLEDNKRNRSFLLAWCGELLASYMVVEASHKETLRAAIEQLYAQPHEARNLSQFVALVAALDPALAQAFAPWHGKGEFAGLLDAPNDALDMEHALHGFNMDVAFRHPACTIPLFSYLLHRVIDKLDGQPTVIVLHEAWALLENAFFAPRLESLLEMLRERNAMVIFATRTPQEHEDSHILPILMQHCATRILVPDDIALDYAAPVLGIGPHEEKLLLKLDRQKGDFLLQQSLETIPLRVNLHGLDDIQAIFADDIRNLIAAGGRFASIPKEKPLERHGEKAPDKAQGAS